MQLTIDGAGLTLDLEDKQSGSIWTGHYSPEKLEELTQKTSSAKKFEVFSQMLIEAIIQPNECVWVDLLTSHDLEMLKNRKMHATGGKQLQPANNNRRYLVLNYPTTYDKVHYPLNLNF